MAWLEAWGTFSKTGPYNNVAMGGSPNGSIHGLDLAQAKAKGYGSGVNFESLNDAGTSVKIELSLIGYAVSNNMQVLMNQKYVIGNFTYDWYVDVYVSTNNGASYQSLEKNILVARHASNQTLAYRGAWDKSNVRWSKTYHNLPSNFTHLKIEVRGDEPAQRHQNTYTRQQVIPPPATFKPWAIRKSGAWKSLDNLKGRFSIRSKGQWVDKSEDSLADVGKVGKGHNRIRKNNQFKQQGRLGG